MVITPGIFLFGLYSDISEGSPFDPLLLLIYSAIVIVFVKNYYGFRFHVELNAKNGSSRAKEVIFYVLWSATLITTFMLGLGMFVSLGSVDEILLDNTPLRIIMYFVFWLFLFTSIYALVIDIRLARSLARQSDPSLGLLEAEDVPETRNY